MDNNDNSGGAFMWGIIIGIAAMYFWHQTVVQGKTAQEWKDSSDSWANSYSTLSDCLTNKATQWDYSNPTYSYNSYAWVYSTYSSITSPTDEMKNCLTNNTTPPSPTP